MNVLCLDQATKISGWSIWEDQKLVAQGKFEFDDSDLVTRIHKIKLYVLQLIEKFDIKKLYLEDIQYQQQAGVTTYKVLAELIGVLQELAFEKQIPSELVHSASWKSTCGIKGRARAEQKASAQQHVKAVYHLDVTQDEADAICIGEHVSKQNECAW